MGLLLRRTRTSSTPVLATAEPSQQWDLAAAFASITGDLDHKTPCSYWVRRRAEAEATRR